MSSSSTIGNNSKDKLGQTDTQKLATHPFSGDGSSEDGWMTRLKQAQKKIEEFMRLRNRFTRLTSPPYLLSPNEHIAKSLEAMENEEAMSCGEDEEEFPFQKKIKNKIGKYKKVHKESKNLFTIKAPRKPNRSELGDVLCIDKYLNNWIKYCSLLPLGYEFEQDKLIQLWIAQRLIEDRKNELMEDVGRSFFNLLREQNFIVPCGFDHFSDQVTYKVGDAMSTLLEKEKEALAPLYCRTDDGQLADVSSLCSHLSLISEDIDFRTFEALKKCFNLCTLLVLCNHGSSITRIPHTLFLSLKFLHTLDLSRTQISELPSSVGNLTLLRFLDVSHTPIKWLPETIDRLKFLQTLRLRSCLSLVGLPKSMNKLTNLRHLDLDITRQLMSMPTGMGSLTCLQTLRAFLVGREEGCHIEELKNLNNLRGSFCISRLENVMNKEEAKDANLSSKQYIDILELRWEDFRDLKAEDEEEILEFLSPHFGLKELSILFFGGSWLPSWISNPSFADLVRITLFMCRNFYLLPSLGELPSLKFLSMVEMNNVRAINSLFCRNKPSQGHHAFPKLEKLTLDVMLNLEEWTGVEDGDFPCLFQLTIRDCPKLISLPLLSRLHSLKYLEIGYCQELLSLAEEKLSTSLEHLIVRDCPKIKECCCKRNGEDWFKIAHVPSVWIDNHEITSDCE